MVQKNSEITAGKQRNNSGKTAGKQRESSETTAGATGLGIGDAVHRRGAR
jgi:hypothetical protein